MLTHFLAAALTAGMAAYLLKLAQLGQLKNDDGSLVPASSSGIRNYIIEKSWSRGKIQMYDGNGDRNGIWNGVDLTMRACKWNPNNELNERQEATGAACELPLQSTLTTTSTTTSTTTTEESSSTSMAMPTLTRNPGTISTPSGSSSAETATATQCLGAGGQGEACVENPTCVSWVPVETSTKEPETTTETEPDPTASEEPEPTETEEHPPLTMKDVVCENEDNSPNHADIGPSEQDSASSKFCEHVSYEREIMGPDDDPIEETILESFDIKYWYKVSWIEDCDRTDVVGQYLQTPLGEDGLSCTEIMRKDFDDCKPHSSIFPREHCYGLGRAQLISSRHGQRRRWRIYRCWLHPVSFRWRYISLVQF